MKSKITAAMRIWNLMRGVSTDEIGRAAGMPFTLAVAGSAANVDALIERLGREKPDASASGAPGLSASIRRVDKGAAVAPGDLQLDADAMAGGEDAFGRALERLIDEHAHLTLALAAGVPAARPIATARLTKEYSRRNARLAGMSALPGVIPAGDWMLPFTAAGDMLVLTRNQIELFLKIAACYGLPADLTQRTREFTMVAGGAFLWRAAARQALGMVPAGIGVAVKAGVAYAGTYAIGRAAAAYYGSGGHRVGASDLRRFVREGIRARLERS